VEPLVTTQPLGGLISLIPLPPVLVWLGRERVLQSKKKDQQYTTFTQEVQYWAFTNYTEQPEYSVIEHSGCHLPASQVGIRWQLPILVG
jgi:hypothetical protein